MDYTYKPAKSSKRTIAIAAVLALHAFIVYALVTGLAMVGAGFTAVQAMGMSLIVFGATAQLGTLPLIVAGAPLWLIVVTALVAKLLQGGR